MATTTFSGIYATTRSYDPTGFYGDETSRVDINTTPLATLATFSQPGSAFSGNNVLGTVAYGGTSFAALASRPIKVGGIVKGFYVWVDNEAIWSGNGTARDTAYILSLDNAYFAANSRISSSSDKVDSAKPPTAPTPPPIQPPIQPPIRRQIQRQIPTQLILIQPPIRRQIQRQTPTQAILTRKHKQTTTQAESLPNPSY